MGLFGARPEAVQRPRTTINGGAQRQPEVPGTIPRRFRLLSECARRLADDPLAAPEQIETPIGDGIGMERLVGRLEPVFERERSLIRWVALRGGLAMLYIHTVDPESLSLPFSPSVEVTMGVGYLPDAAGGDPVLSVGPDWRDRLSAEEQQAAIGVAAAVGTRVVNYPEIEGLSFRAAAGHPLTRGVNDAIGLDLIAWSVIAMLRTGIAGTLAGAPEADALTTPGWYTEPVFAKCERYWDGADWTERCRVPEGRRYTELSNPLTWS